MKLKRSAICIAAALMLVSTGCEQLSFGQEPEPIAVEVKTGMPDYSTATGVVDLNAWVGPQMTDEAYKDYADCGYNMLFLGNTSVFTGNATISDEKINQTLDTHFTLAEKYDIRLILSMVSPAQDADYGTPFEYVYKRHAPILEKWRDSEIFYGYSAWDEPFFLKGLKEGDPEKLQYAYDDIAEFYQDDYLYFANKFPGKKYSITMVRDADIGETTKYNARFKTYEEYMEHYCSHTLKYMPYEDRVLHMDAYPLMLKSGTTDLYYIRECAISSLEKMGYKAEEYHAEKWMSMQGYQNIFNTGSVLYQYYTAMAYGYTHFATYTYGEPSWHLAQTLVNANGEKTDVYYYYKGAHEEIKTFENVYREFTDDWQGVLAYAGTQSTQPEKPWRKNSRLLEKYHRIANATSTEDMLIGVMRDKNGYEGFMISNQVEPFYNFKNNVEITFNQADKAIVYQDGAEAKIVPLTNGKLSLTLKSGGGAFVIPVKEA